MERDVVQVKSEVILPRKEVMFLRQRVGVAILDVRPRRDEVALLSREPIVMIYEHRQVD